MTLPSICFFLFLFRSESEDELLSSTHLDKASGKLLFLKILRNKTKIKTFPTKQAFPKRKKLIYCVALVVLKLNAPTMPRHAADQPG